MSDLTASQCGCNSNDNGCCNSLIWIILLSCICGNNNGNGCSCGMGSNFLGGGCGDNGIIWIILLLCCCCNN